MTSIVVCVEVLQDIEPQLLMVVAGDDVDVGDCNNESLEAVVGNYLVII